MNHERIQEISPEMSGILDEEHSQTHEDREAQKIVERIEKKVSDQRESIREDAGQASTAFLSAFVTLDSGSA
jgi:predicted  nucleic acid-binding Zn-ribbon protein